ncbi:AlpA family transcriptional regulator [Agrococcus sp. TF02-05]|uniref:helix-turn-helix transcriptional regulator n=1 Tax=Agrococcus sp. TF02-05 TaxID=2815211 RepID=UPI001AA0C0E4|nr:hypothetical protein [Agrococcus sp. TF02-05]MBO1770469.1 hypothetical protein [Agrococcus sp. TF02-05]
MPDTPDLIGRAEAAAILGVSRRHLARLPLEPAMQLPGTTGAVLYHRADVEALAERRAA